MKFQAIKALLEPRRWNESVNLASSIINSMSQELKLPLLKTATQSINGSPAAFKVEDGVYARNLYIARRTYSSLHVYLECLHYDFDQEFEGMAKRDATATYHGIKFDYPARINSVVSGIRSGLMRYFETFPLN